jgi:hypothetical protein
MERRVVKQTDSFAFPYVPMYLYLWLYSRCWALVAFSVFWSFYTVGRTSLTGGSARRKVATYIQDNSTQTQNKHTETFMAWVGFEPTILAFELAKTVDAWDCAATVIGRSLRMETSITYTVYVIRDGSVGIVSRREVGWPGNRDSIPGRGKIFCFAFSIRTGIVAY